MNKAQTSNAFWRIVMLLTIASLMVGCGEHAHEDHDEGAAGSTHSHGMASHDESVSFKEGKGLLLAPELASHIGLRVEDVSERAMAETMSFDAEVYRSAAGAQVAGLDGTVPVVSMASGLLSGPRAAKLESGQEVAVEGKFGRLSGRIAEIHSAGTQREVLLAISDAKRELTHGTKVRVTVAIGKEKTITSIPASALLRTFEGTFVYTVSGERFIRTPVEIGSATNEFIEVTDGLYAGDQVVAHPVMKLWLAELQVIRGGKACADGD